MPKHLRDPTSVAISSPFLISLALLVVNDWYLKGAWGNWFTGKLSDFAGIYLLALLSFALLPRHKLPVAIGIGCAFAVWKSSLSESAIALIHVAGLPRFDRVVDYTDLVALAVLPGAWHAAARRPAIPAARSNLRRALAIPALAVAAAAMIATSYAAQGEGYEIRSAGASETFDPLAIVAAIESAAEQQGLRRVENVRTDGVTVYAAKWVELRYAVDEGPVVRIAVTERGGGMFRRKGPQKVEQLREQIIGVLMRQFDGIELVRPIPGEPWLRLREGQSSPLVRAD